MPTSPAVMPRAIRCGLKRRHCLSYIRRRPIASAGNASKTSANISPKSTSQVNPTSSLPTSSLLQSP